LRRVHYYQLHNFDWRIITIFSLKLLVVCLSITLLFLTAPDLRAQEKISPAHLAGILRQNPDNHAARWAFAQAAFQAGSYDVARYNVERLLHIARSQNDIDVLIRALTEITKLDPWGVSLSFALLPSTNIRRTTYNDQFVTNLGIFNLAGEGEEESGLGISLDSALSYSLSVSDRSQLTLKALISHNIYDVSDLNQSNVRFAVSQEMFFVGGSAVIEPYVRFRFDELQNLERRDVGLSFSRSWWREDGAQFRATINVENHNYIESDSLSGPYGKINLRYSYSLDERTKFGFGVSLARSEPQENHFRYLEGRVSADILRNFSNLGNIGLFGSFTTREYDDFFPATNLVRQDETVIFGASYSLRSFEIYGSRPRLSCQNEQNLSNIALYEYETTDCGITFERSFWKYLDWTTTGWRR
jgi:hypothetical protein